MKQHEFSDRSVSNPRHTSGMFGCGICGTAGTATSFGVSSRPSNSDNQPRTVSDDHVFKGSSNPVPSRYCKPNRLYSVLPTILLYFVLFSGPNATGFACDEGRRLEQVFYKSRDLFNLISKTWATTVLNLMEP